jgi:Protein of unknown function (DUF952)
MSGMNTQERTGAAPLCRRCPGRTRALIATGSNQQPLCSGDDTKVCIFGWMVVYKILLPNEWDAFDAAGQFVGSTFDRDSGFIHLSSRDQVAETARRAFSG